MTVSELMEMLEDCDPDATVRIMSQPNWPFEYAIRGLTVREELLNIYEDQEDEGDGFADGLEANDVFIVEGAQERYGDKSAWEVARR